MLVEDVMSTNVVTVDEDAMLREAVAVMCDRGVGSVISTTGTPPRKTGILTELDVKRAVSQIDGPLSSLGRIRVAIGVLLGTQSDRPLPSMTVDDCTSQPLVTVSPEMTLSDAVLKMREEAVNHLVVTEQMNLQGVVAPQDVAFAHDDVVDEVRRINARKPNWSE